MSRLVQLLRADLPRIIGVGLLMQGLTLLSGPLLARMLGPTGRGEVVTVLAVAMICTTFTTMSLDKGVAKAVAEKGGPARDVLRPFLPTWLLWRTIPAVAAALGTWAALHGSAHVVPLAVEAFFLTLLGTTLGLVRSMVWGEQNIRRVNLCDMALMTTYVATVALLFVVDRDSDPHVVLLCQLAGQLLSLAIAVTGLRPTEGLAADPATRAEVHSFARRAYFGSIGTLDRLGLDQLLIGQLLTTAALGLYAVASSIATLPAVLIGMLANPLLSKMAGRSPDEAVVVLRRWVLAALLLGGGMVLALEVVISPVIRILFGHDFVGSIPSARLLLVANVAFSLRGLLASAAQAQGRAGAASAVTLASSVALLVALVVGAQVDGLFGASVGITAAAVLGALGLASIVRWKRGETVGTAEQLR